MVQNKIMELIKWYLDYFMIRKVNLKFGSKVMRFKILIFSQDTQEIEVIAT